MIDINICLRWPTKKWNLSKDYFCKTWVLSKNKAFEIQATNWNNGTIFEFRFDWSRCQDHAGVQLELGLFNRGIIFNFYDRRHWNYEEGRYQTDEEAKAEAEEWAKEKQNVIV